MEVESKEVRDKFEKVVNLNFDNQVFNCICTMS